MEYPFSVDFLDEYHNSWDKGNHSMGSASHGNAIERDLFQKVV